MNHKLWIIFPHWLPYRSVQFSNLQLWTRSLIMFIRTWRHLMMTSVFINCIYWCQTRWARWSRCQTEIAFLSRDLERALIITWLTMWPSTRVLTVTLNCNTTTDTHSDALLLPPFRRQSSLTPQVKNFRPLRLILFDVIYICTHTRILSLKTLH